MRNHGPAFHSLYLQNAIQRGANIPLFHFEAVVVSANAQDRRLIEQLHVGHGVTNAKAISRVRRHLCTAIDCDMTILAVLVCAHFHLGQNLL